MLRRTVFSGVGAVVVAAAVSCGGDSDDGSTDETQPEITIEQLGQLVLSLEQFGPEYAAFLSGEENGFKTIDQVAEGEDDPAAERADLERFGWSASYESFYVNPNGEDSVGVRTVGSIVDLFGSAEGLAGYFVDSVAELDDSASKEGSSVLRAAERFEVDVGDEAIGLRIEEDIEKEDGSILDFSAGVVLFRRGRLLGSAVISAAGLGDVEKNDLEVRVEALARILDEKMLGA